jgi:diacylglycerol kinase (ATP)
MPVGIIINPISGSSGHNKEDVARERRARAERGARDAGVDVEIVFTRARGHAGSLAAAFAERDMDVVAWGGDGTVNEAAGPLIGGPRAIGIVPSGSGDGLARGLGLPLTPAEALPVALAARAQAIDIGLIGQRHFLNIAGIGFDAAVATRFNARRIRGWRGYIESVLSLVWSYEAQRYSVSLDERPIADGNLFLIGFANARMYGNGLVLAPDASPCDGRFDVVMVGGGRPIAQLWRARRLVLFCRRPARGVHRAYAKTARVSGERLLCHVDGEAFSATGGIDVRIQPAALRVKGFTPRP